MIGIPLWRWRSRIYLKIYENNITPLIFVLQQNLCSLNSSDKAHRLPEVLIFSATDHTDIDTSAKRKEKNDSTYNGVVSPTWSCKLLCYEILHSNSRVDKDVVPRAHKLSQSVSKLLWSDKLESPFLTKVCNFFKQTRFWWLEPKRTGIIYIK